MPQNKKNDCNQAGNVFIIILVAVVLFGALIFTFSRSGSQGVSSISKQEAKIYSQEILNYARIIEGAVDRVRRNGCSETEISFENSVLAVFSNPNAPIDKSCHIFEPEGGKIDFLKNNTKIYIAPNVSIYFVQGARVLGVGSTKTDLLLTIITTKSVCREINKTLENNVNYAPDNFEVDPFIGDFTLNTTPDIGDENTSVQGLDQFCLDYTSGSGIFVSVLLAR